MDPRTKAQLALENAELRKEVDSLRNQLYELRQIQKNAYKHNGSQGQVQESLRPLQKTGIKDDREILFSVIQDAIELERAEVELTLFKAIINSSQEAISIVAPNGRFLYVNPAHERLFGRSIDEARRLNFRDYYPPESIARMEKEMSFLSWEAELDVYDAGGRRFPLWHSAGSVCDNEGNKLYGFAFMHDITIRKQAEEKIRDSEARFRAAAEGRLDAFFVLQNVRDREGKTINFTITEMNSHAEQILQMPRNEVSSKRLDEFQKPAWLPLLGERCIKVVETGQTLDEEYLFPEGENEQRWFHHQIVPLPDGVAISHRDITDRKLAEKEAAVKEERQRLARELHDSVTQSIYSLTLLSEGWRRKVRMASPGEVEEWLVRLGDLARQVLKEMRLLLYELRPVSRPMEDLTAALRFRLGAVEERSGIKTTFKVEGEFDLPALTEEQLFKIAYEALNNSLKHASASEVRVNLRKLEHKVEMEIQDNGCGFEPSQAIYQRGMGLTIMQERTKELGGVLVIQSSPGCGTMVKVIV